MCYFENVTSCYAAPWLITRVMRSLGGRVRWRACESNTLVRARVRVCACVSVLRVSARAWSWQANKTHASK